MTFPGVDMDFFWNCKKYSNIKLKTLAFYSSVGNGKIPTVGKIITAPP